jgi:outer membrane protein
MTAASKNLRRVGEILAMLAFAGCVTPPVAAKEEPLLEVGLGIGAVAFEDYRGSDTTHAYPLPIPYFLYNGKFLKADREGIRGQLFDQDWVELNLSGNATTPVRNDRARSGMPDLRSTLELGPSLDFHLLRSADAKIKFDLRLPLRAAVTVEASPRYIGWTFTPRFAVDIADPLGAAGWNPGIPGKRGLRGHASHHRRVEAIPPFLGRGLRALRYPLGSLLRREPACQARQLLVGRVWDFLDDSPFH